MTTIAISHGAYQRLDENLTVPNDGYKYVRLKHWIELGKGDNADPYPEIIDKGDGWLTFGPDGVEYDYVSLTEPYQWLLWQTWDYFSQYKLPRGKIERFYKKPGNERTFAEATPGSLAWVYVNMAEAHRAFTEAGSPEAGFIDYVLPRQNQSISRGYQWLFRATGGAMLRVLRTNGAEYVIEAIDVLKPAPSVKEVVKRGLYFWCTQSGKYSGSTRFPQIKNANAVHGYPPAGIASPLFSLGGTIRVKKTVCVDLIPGSAYTPYQPV